MTSLMNNSVLQKKVTVGLSNGLHLRPQSMIVQVAQTFESELTLTDGVKKVDLKSMLDLMTLGAEFGTELILEATGPDSSEAIQKISELFESDFDECLES